MLMLHRGDTVSHMQNALLRRKRTAEAVLTKRIIPLRHGSSSLTRLTGQSAMTLST
jgi:hypothetical protein